MIADELEKLLQIRGMNPCPADHAAYWERALAEMNAVDPQVELRPSQYASPVADLFDMYFTGVRGARIHAKLLRPKKPFAKEKGPGLLMFHGYGGDCGEFADKLAYAASGFTVAALDARGQGGQSEDTSRVKGPTLRGQLIRGLQNDSPDDLLFRQIFLDAAELAKIVMAMPGVDPTRMGVTGASQGGALSLVCAALVPEIRAAAVAYPGFCDYQRKWSVQHGNASGEISELNEYFYWFDPHHEHEEEIFTKLGYVDVQHLAPRIRAKVIMASAFSDVLCLPATQFAAYNRITAPKKVYPYPEFGHGYLLGWSDLVYQHLTRELL